MPTATKSHTLEVTDIRGFNLVNKPPTLAYCDVEFNGGLIVKGFKILETETEQGKRIWVSAPARPQPEKGKNGKPTGKTKWSDIVFCEKDTGAWQYIQSKVLDYFHKNSSKSMP